MTAETAAPRACARILNNQGGLGIDESKSKGISDAGVALNVQATVDWINGGANTFVQADIGKYASCPAGSDASARTTDSEGKGIDSINFFVSFVG